MAPTLPQANFWRTEPDKLPAPRAPAPFAGRIGANQEFSLDRRTCADTELLKNHPDAAPWVPLRDSLSLKQFLDIGLWRAAATEGIGMLASTNEYFTKCETDLMASLLGTCFFVYLTIVSAVGLLENMKWVFRFLLNSYSYVNPAVKQESCHRSSCSHFNR